MEVVSREFYTLDGKKVKHFSPQEVYLMKVTDKNGKIHTMKVVKN